MKKVVIVIGHGPKHDTGAVGRDNVTELAWNTDLAERIKHALIAGRKLDAVIVKRVTEELQPVLETNATNANFAIELHLNSTPGASGTEMIHAPQSPKGIALAKALQKAAVGVLGLPDRGVKPPWKGRGLRWLNGTKMPAVIVESFFIDNPHDLRVGNFKKQKLAEAYAEALADYATPVEPLPTSPATT